MSPSELKILFIGDIIGRPGRETVKKLLPKLREQYHPDLIIVNGENSAGGAGITENIYKELIGLKIDAITQGNHIWNQKEFASQIDVCSKVVRPANYPPGVPGREKLILEKEGVKVGVISLLGRVFMRAIDCPFRVGEKLIADLKKETEIIIIDIHGEATSEKSALGWYFDGKVSALLGTHTHIQTADERILPRGTAFISDVGMVGSYNSIIGVEIEPILQRFLTAMPVKFEPEKTPPIIFNAVVVTIEVKTAKATDIVRVWDLVE